MFKNEANLEIECLIFTIRNIRVFWQSETYSISRLFCRIMKFSGVDPLRRNLLLHNTRNQVTQGIGRI